MREQLNFRQKDLDWGHREGLTEGRTEVINGLKLLLRQEDQITNKEKLEYLLKCMAEEDAKGCDLSLM